MSRMTWLDAFQALGEAVFALVRAEVEALLEEWKKAGLELAKILALAFGSLLLFVYLPFLLLFALVDGVAAWRGWPMWGAALAVLGGALLFLALLGAIAAWIWNRRLVGPTVSLQRRLDGHGDWWQRRVYLEREALEASDEPD